ncbi:MAG: ABC transporter permease, partial [Thermoanaerobaculia bacterium]|nr:ABC transporter permease [Thermoanaerobaculia bacterium]
VIRSLVDSKLAAPDGSRLSRVHLAGPDGGPAGRLRVGFQYTAPSNVVLFVMINGFVASIGIVAQRRSGMSRRLLATPARTWELFLMLAVGPAQRMVVQAVFLIGITALAFGVPWGDALGVALVTLGLVAVGVSLVFLMGTIFRTEEQAGSVGPLLGIVLGMLGGCMWPLEVVPPLMKQIGLLSPAAWAMDGYLALIFGRVGAGAILPAVGGLLGMATAFTALGIVRLRPQFSR